MTVIFHVDLDAFYASVEQVDHPEYRGKPVIIGALPGTRGVVSACSYEARKFGVRSAMPISQAYRKCPSAIFLRVRMQRYQEVSCKIMELFEKYTPEVYQISIDEAFLDMTGTERLFGSPLDAARRIKEEVKEKTGLTISIGIAGNRYLAKLASDYKKPDGLYMVKEGEEEAFLDNLQVKDLWGVGKKTLERLEDLNIRSIPQLRQFSEALLKSIFGKAGGAYLYRAVRGIDPGIFRQEPGSHSISHEITFEADTRDREVIKKCLLELTHQVMFRMIKDCYRGKTVFLKLRYSDFTTITVQTTLRHFVNSAEELYSMAMQLLEKRWDRIRPIRLLGTGVSSLERADTPRQHELFEDEYDKKKKVEEAVYNIRRKMPGNIVIKASLLKKRED
ncbi:MAG: DNA polymerase IV [Spirochaetes bacterium]|nr:MAG: DNA polymerase IV [Spirochaetota bacterium]